jgi:hypothetical protein
MTALVMAERTETGNIVAERECLGRIWCWIFLFPRREMCVDFGQSQTVIKPICSQPRNLQSPTKAFSFFNINVYKA